MKQVAPDVWHLPGWPPGWINVYLVGDVLVDASRRGVGPGIVKELGDRSISEVALTHVHPDHQGAAGFICEKYAATLACHADDKALMEGEYDRGSLPLIARISVALFAGPPHRVDRVLAEGDDVAGFTVYHTPGHSPGHVVFFRERDGVAIVGDVVNTMNLATTARGLHEPPTGFTPDPVQNRRSIRKLAELDPQVICAGHGPVWRDRPAFKEFVRRLPQD
ncbi:MAG: MBL fold metallo-hydrolase [Candidatus Dormibacteria bacterium]